MKKEISRRSFILGGSAAAAGAFTAGAAFAAPYDPMPAKWDETVDVIVVGSGFAGLAASIEARKAGADTLVLEKMALLGGNSKINGGIISVPGNYVQKAWGIKDSPELLAEDILREGMGYSYPEKVKTMTENAYPTWEWCVNELKVEFKKDIIGQEGGHSVPRHFFTVNSVGADIVSKEIEYAEKLGVKIRTRCYVERIIRDTDGRVKGLKVREGYKFPHADSGTEKYIQAVKGVVLCHGGFGADVKYRMKFDPKLTAKFDTTNQPGATSEMWREAARIGASLVQQDWIQCGPWTSPEEKGMGTTFYFAQSAGAEQGLWVDCTTGKRFVNELANRKVRADAIINNGNKGHLCIAIADQAALDNSCNKTVPKVIQKMIQQKTLHKFDTLEALAAEYKIPLEPLKESIAGVNAALAAKGGDEMGRNSFAKDAKPLGTAPWYCTLLSPKVHHCMGGLETDSNAQVIDASTDEPIPGLFAAGESTGGVHGAVRLGSCATLDCLVNGRIAGASVAK